MIQNFNYHSNNYFKVQRCVVRYTISQNQPYGLSCPITCFIVSAAFISSVISSKRRGKYNTINWKGRKYAIFKVDHICYEKDTK
jgi:hypothetical protein